MFAQNNYMEGSQSSPGGHWKTTQQPLEETQVGIMVAWILVDAEEMEGSRMQRINY